jgi:hypothetical protein
MNQLWQSLERYSFHLYRSGALFISFIPLGSAIHFIYTAREHSAISFKTQK